MPHKVVERLCCLLMTLIMINYKDLTDNKIIPFLYMHILEIYGHGKKSAIAMDKHKVMMK